MRALAALVAALAFLVAALAFLVAPPQAASAATTLPLSPKGSHAIFVVTHLFIERVTGSVPIVAGHATFEDGAQIPQRVDATLDPHHIDTHDADRDADLQGPDWFDVERFPMWTFASTAIAPAPGGFTLTGTLTIHGVAQPVTLAVTTVAGPPQAHYHATGTIHRHDFGMRVTPIDGVVGNDLDLTLDVTFGAAT